MKGAYPVSLRKLNDHETVDGEDIVAVEEPLEIRLGFSRKGTERVQPISVTMRTPGDDFSLAVGFLLTEKIVASHGQIVDVKHCGENENVVRVTLREDVDVDIQKLQRNFYVTSSCGVCGKSSIEALDLAGYSPVNDEVRVHRDVVYSLPDKLRETQPLFTATGGNHGCAFFTPDGEIVSSTEDVGRHNALDKLIGSAATHGIAPSSYVLVLSGRASFELVQKALSCGVEVIVAVGAPSSLAVQTATEFGQTLAGFTSATRANVYSGAHRLI